MGSSFDLSGKVALVTGASGGLGLHFARTLSRAGAKVALAARRTDRLEANVAAIRDAGGEAVALADRCPHRFAPLSRGRVVDDTLECPYHGLRFGAHGHCVFNPHGDGRVPARAPPGSPRACG